MASINPVLLQRQLSMRLRELRQRAGLTVEEVAGRLMCSATKISRIETGARRASPRDVRDLCVLYELEDGLANELIDMARRAREVGWWTEYDNLRLSPYVGLEQAASSITSFSMFSIPPLLQTAEYARHYISQTKRNIDTWEVDAYVEVTLRRQELLKQETILYTALIDESTFHRRVDDSNLMQAQIDTILSSAVDHRVAVQIIPFKQGIYPCPDNNFCFLQFSETAQAPLVFIEGPFGIRYQERSGEVSRYMEALDLMRDVALSPQETMRFVMQLRDQIASW